MRNPWADEFERSVRSRHCVRGLHQDCAHLCGVGGGFNPRRLRPEFGAVLCRCECHSSCPVSGKRMAAPVSIWRQSCSCAGAEQERRRQDAAGAEFPDFREYLAQGRRKSQLRKEAFDTVQAEAAGLSDQEIRTRYEAELRSRGLPVPPQEVIDANVAALKGDYLPSARLLGRTVADAAKLLVGIFRPSP